MPQLALAFESAPHYHAEDFIVSESNRLAHAHLAAWPEWPAYGLYLYGPHGSGKTHLARIWQERSHATCIDARTLSENDLAALAPSQPTLVVEDIEHCAAPERLFHLLNLIKERRGSVLLTSSLPAAGLPFTLPDLTSRLRALPGCAMAAPDDALLRAVLCKQFADRQLRVAPEVVEYVLARTERSMAALHHLAGQLDQAALRDQRALSIPYVRSILEQGS